MKKVLVITLRSVTVKLPVDVCYKHYDQSQVEHDIDEVAKSFGASHAHLEYVEDDEL